MAVSIDYATKVISVPQADLTSLGGSRYELDVDVLRLALRALEANETGIVFDITHNHNTAVSLSGVTYARVIEFINSYTINFEDGNYAVVCVGANHNIADVKTVDSVSLIIGNSAGLIQVTSGSGVLPSDIVDIADAVWNEAIGDHTTAGSTGEALDNISGGSSPETIAGAVWAYLISDASTAGSTGKALNLIKLLTMSK